MLETRDVCSGATGRNGGHISPKMYQDYSEVAAKYGPSAAQAIMRFRLAHLSALLEVATKEGLLRESQACRVDQFDAYPQDKVYRRAKNALEGYLTACPKRRGKHVVSDDDKSALKVIFPPFPPGKVNFRDSNCYQNSGMIPCSEVGSSSIAMFYRLGFLSIQQLISQSLGPPALFSRGGLYLAAGRRHPYRLITEILSRLLAAYPRHVSFPCWAPCFLTLSSVSSFSRTRRAPISFSQSTEAVIATSQGILNAAHVMHAANAWASHLLPGMRRKIVPSAYT
jgi:hypothetical protein